MRKTLFIAICLFMTVAYSCTKEDNSKDVNKEKKLNPIVGNWDCTDMTIQQGPYDYTVEEYIDYMQSVIDEGELSESDETMYKENIKVLKTLKPQYIESFSISFLEDETCLTIHKGQESNNEKGIWKETDEPDIYNFVYGEGADVKQAVLTMTEIGEKGYYIWQNVIKIHLQKQ